MKLIQHKREAFWFYRFLSNFYDHYVNPLFWTTGMRDASLELAGLKPHQKVADVGSGTGFTTEGIARWVDGENIECLDQSPHQMARAKAKAALQDCRFHLGDAEDLPFPTDAFDRYVSAGSIEYWPDPQRGIAEAYRILKPEGLALMIGPLRPKNLIGRWIADTWMLFPEERDYYQWFEAAGFVNIRKRYIAPKWVLKEPYGIAMVGEKPQPGPSALSYEPARFEARKSAVPVKSLPAFLGRLLAGSLAGFLFIPMALLGYLRYGVLKILGRSPVHPEVARDRLPLQLKLVLAFLGLALVAALAVRYAG